MIEHKYVRVAKYVTTLGVTLLIANTNPKYNKCGKMAANMDDDFATLSTNL